MHLRLTNFNLLSLSTTLIVLLSQYSPWASDYDINGRQTLVDAAFCAYDDGSLKERESIRDEFTQSVMLKFKNAKPNELVIREISDFLFAERKLISGMTTDSSCSVMRLLRDKVGHCASLSVIYACVFEILRFDYEICILPEHMFISVKLDHQPIYIETTDAGAFYYSIEDYMHTIKRSMKYGASSVIKLSSQQFIGFVLCDASRLKSDSTIALQYARRGVELSEGSPACLSTLAELQFRSRNTQVALTNITKCFKAFKRAGWRESRVLYAAATGDASNIVDSIVDGCVLNYASLNGKTIAHQANSLEVAQFLYYCGVDFNTTFQGDYPIHIAVSKGLNSVVAWLIETGVPVDHRNSHGATPLLCSGYSGNLELSKFLVDNGASLDCKTVQGSNLLHLSTLSKCDPMIAFCLDKKMSIDAQDNEGQTPMHYAVLWCDEPTVRALLTHGASRTIKDKDGRTPLDLALKYRRSKFVRLLTEASKSYQQSSPCCRNQLFNGTQ